LLDDGRWKIRAISRDPASDAARRLSADGIEVIAADMDDSASLRAAFSGAHGVYSVQSAANDCDAETRRGIAVADAAQDANVEHFIYGSVGGADRGSGVPHFESKWRIENHIRALGIPASIVRPAFFMDNFIGLAQRAVVLALLRSYLPAEKPLQMIATTDIGAWAANAFAHPEAFIGRVEEIAGDELTRPEIYAAIKRQGWTLGLPFTIPRSLLRALPSDVLRMFEWFGEAGYMADIPALRTRQAKLLTLDDWLTEQAL
jgi:uncharacterized protein YbjT (DUF2867 family)